MRNTHLLADQHDGSFSFFLCPQDKEMYSVSLQCKSLQATALLRFSGSLVTQEGSTFLLLQLKTEHVSVIILKTVTLSLKKKGYIATPGFSSDTSCFTVALPCKLTGLAPLGSYTPN